MFFRNSATRVVFVTSSIARPISGGAKGSPFDLSDEQAYLAWRERKLAGVPRSIEELQVAIQDGYQLRGQEMNAAHNALQRANFVIYTFKRTAGEDKAVVRQLGRQFGLERLDDNLCSDEDSITSLKVVGRRREGEYIPYTNKRLNWHTDGYYNSPDRQIRGVILHCVRPAAVGGESVLMDHEIAYIQLRDENPGYIRALMAADAMTIPPNVQNGKQIRPEQSGPVFSVSADGPTSNFFSDAIINLDSISYPNGKSFSLALIRNRKLECLYAWLNQSVNCQQSGIVLRTEDREFLKHIPEQLGKQCRIGATEIN